MKLFLFFALLRLLVLVFQKLKLEKFYPEEELSLLFQYVSYSYIMSKHGLFASIKVGSLLATPITILLPISVYLNQTGNDSTKDDLTWSAYIFLCVILGIKNIAVNLSFSSLTIAVNRSVPSTQRASVNGLSMLGGSVGKALGPICAGYLATLTLSGTVFVPSVGVMFLFGCIGIFGIGCALFISIVMGQHYDNGKLIVSKQ